MKEWVEGELWSLAEIVTIFVPWHFLSVAIKSEVVNLVVETDRSDGRCFQRLTQLLHLFWCQLIVKTFYEFNRQHATFYQIGHKGTTKNANMQVKPQKVFVYLQKK